MRAVFLLLAVMVVFPAYGQVGLTPEKQVTAFCNRAMEYRARGFGDGTAINNACGNSAAIQATIAQGRPGLNALSSLLGAARAARDSSLQAP